MINETNQILIANYAGVILLPGGKVDKNETIYKAIIRELSEELGQTYNPEELTFLTTVNHYQKLYPKTDGTQKNRLVVTHYFLGNYKQISQEYQRLTEKEKNAKFTLQLISLENLENLLLSNTNQNPRNEYFQRELLIVLKQILKTDIKRKTRRKHNENEEVAKH